MQCLTIGSNLNIAYKKTAVAFLALRHILYILGHELPVEIWTSHDSDNGKVLDGLKTNSKKNKDIDENEDESENMGMTMGDVRQLPCHSPNLSGSDCDKIEFRRMIWHMWNCTNTSQKIWQIKRKYYTLRRISTSCATTAKSVLTNKRKYTTILY